MLDYLNNVLNVSDAKLESMDDDSVVAYIREKLDRPLRVCGMVKNEGEPGGGPFIAYNTDGSTSPQILESNQVDPNNEEYQK